jgi:uncharacterized protein YhaN
MRFKEAEVFGFGKIKDNLRIPFAERINVMLAPNDKGKSTFIEFIYAVLYPFGDLKTDSGRKKRARFKPWNSDIYGGRVDIALHKGGDYRIEKIIEASPREDKLGVFKSENGNFSALKIFKQDKSLGLLVGDQFLNISRDVFESLSMVRQFDVATIGESKKIMDEVRSIIEIGRSGGGLSGALKKIQEKRAKIGLFEKRGKRTIAGSKQIEYDQVKRDIEIFKQQFDKNRQQLLERRGLELKLEELKSRLDNSLMPKIDGLKKKLTLFYSAVKSGYEAIPPMLREMSLKDFQGFKKCGEVIRESKLKLKNLDIIAINREKALKHNIFLFWLSLAGCPVFLTLYLILNTNQARYLFISFALFLSLAALYFLRLVRREKVLVLRSKREREKIKSEISLKVSESGILKNMEEPKEVEFYEELWAGLLTELGVESIEELEELWYQSRDYSDNLKSLAELNITKSSKGSIDLKLELKSLEALIADFKSSVQERKDLESNIKNTQINIDMIDKTIASYMPADDIAVLAAEEAKLEAEIKRISLYKEALDIATLALQEAGSELYSEVSPYINDFVNRHFHSLSDDYDFIKVDTDLSICLKPKNHPELIPIEQAGKGIQSALYLLLRFAIISLFKMNNGEQLPFILDETLNVLDDFDYNHQERVLQLFLDLCYEYDLQMVYLTCQKRGQYLPIKEFFEDKGLALREQTVGDFTILQGGRDENEFN